MAFAMTSGNLVQLGLGALMAIGLVLLIIGVVLLIRSRVHGPDTHVEAGTVRIIAGPAAMILIAGVLLLGGGGFFLSQTVTGQPAAANTPSTSPIIPVPPSASPSSRPTEPFANVTYPIDGTKVSRQNGFVMGGSVADPGQWTVWILDHPSPHSYFVDVKANIKTMGTGRRPTCRWGTPRTHCRSR